MKSLTFRSILVSSGLAYVIVLVLFFPLLFLLLLSSFYPGVKHAVACRRDYRAAQFQASVIIQWGNPKV